MFRSYINFMGIMFNKNYFKIVFCDEYPERIDTDIIYIMGEGRFFWSIILKCPCGCGDIMQLNLHKDTHPYWNIKFHISGAISISPSIWKKDGCRAHFYIKRSNLIWAGAIQRHVLYKDRV